MFEPKTSEPSPLRIADLGSMAKRRGFSDGEAPQSTAILNRIGYQHASSYFDLFKKPDGTVENDASMKELNRVILFDRKYQALLFEHIGLFELQFRAQYAYHMSEKRGAFAHRNPKNFKDRDHFNEFLKRYGSEYNRQIRNHNPDITKANEKYGDAPTWLAVEIMSFGTLSMLYNNTKSKDVRKGVAMSFGCTAEELSSWARCLSGARNTCAHFGRLCGTQLTSKPRTISGTKGWDNGSPFYVALILLYVFRTCDFFDDDATLSYNLSMMCDLLQLFNDFDDVLTRCGVPRNWLSMMIDKRVTGLDIALANDFAQNRGKPGRTWLTVKREDGTVSRLA
ncbi:Abi family protein [Adlercreutzia sp. ZJ305]|nr:Abi family protein [Adlercreutzia sp. ZJ305]